MNHEIKEIKRTENGFPEILKRIKSCPEKLFYRGRWNEGLFKKSLAVVGSRKMTEEGKRSVIKLVPQLINKGVIIVSGFAQGVDSEAHWQCVRMKKPTVAVLGWGLNYNGGDRKLFDEILRNDGVIISEYEPDFEPTRWSFPQRNRIVVGLSSLGVLVIEAAENSGSLITTRIANKEKRAVWAVPGKTSPGTNWLIREGLAKAVRKAGDIVEKTEMVMF